MSKPSETCNLTCVLDDTFIHETSFLIRSVNKPLMLGVRLSVRKASTADWGLWWSETLQLIIGMRW
jgi:hypothetical protein